MDKPIDADVPEQFDPQRAVATYRSRNRSNGSGDR